MMSEKLSTYLVNSEFQLFKWHRLCYITDTSDHNIRHKVQKNVNYKHRLKK